MEKSKQKYQIVVLSLVMLMAWFMPLFASQNMSALAISADYPAQLMNIATKDNSKVLTENGTADNSTISVKALSNDLSSSWRFDRVGSDSKGTYFKLVNAQSGRMLTPSGYNVKASTDVIMYGAESAQSQHWYVVPVKNDSHGNGLYYKIVNYSDTSLALTQGSSGMILSGYTGADNQLWLLNADGLQGFAGHCFDDNTGNVKAADIGGLFGEVVEAGDFNTLKKYAESDTPYTIVVTKNISVTELNLNGERYMCTAGRIYLHSNKTIIGSYGNHTLYNVQFCTNSGKGVGDNIIIKNFESTHDAESNNNDSIQFYFGSGKNIWVDHVTFVGHDNYGYAPKTGKVDEDKFLACCYDADYCTVSDCSFGKHKYGLILGYPADDENSKAKYDGFPRMTLISNKFNGCNTRGPGLMRWGYYHSLNNYVNDFSMAYTVLSNCDIYAENCVYENGGNVICDWGDWLYVGHYTETGSVFSGCNRTQQGGDSNSTATATSWRPKNNYSYISISANNAKTYCNTYSGCQSSGGNMMYLRFGTKGVPSAGFNTAPDGPMTPPTPVAETFKNGATYRIKNVNSGLYMQVAGAKAENGTNVQQWGTSDDTIHDIWKLISAGDGYYYIVSAVGDGGTYVLDVAGKKTDNGTNIDIYQSNKGTNQQFMFTKNSDGSYKILTKVSSGKSAVEVANADKSSGANIQQWELNDAGCQNWILESVANPGCTMDTSFVYEFKNVNSGMVMDIANGKMEAGTNVQQWSSNGYDCQRWTLQAFSGGGNYYYIRSVSNPTYVLRADSSSNGGNIAIAEYSTKDSAMLFKFIKNLDGTYSIMTRASKDLCFVEVARADKESGANVQQWENTESSCQKWSAETLTTTKATTTTTKATTTTTVPTTTTTETTAPVKGDINNDGFVNVSDAVLLSKYILGSGTLTVAQAERADMNSDNRLDVFDMILIRQSLL
ncbi:MAG: RICIN domain-containing protein [Ruminococcus sp.]|nr:RICIN domain-containing protein [Ruminococcus sp.]